jgi:hypothetical protein
MHGHMNVKKIQNPSFLRPQAASHPYLFTQTYAGDSDCSKQSVFL